MSSADVELGLTNCMNLLFDPFMRKVYIHRLLFSTAYISSPIYSKREKRGPNNKAYSSILLYFRNVSIKSSSCLIVLICLPNI